MISDSVMPRSSSFSHGFNASLIAGLVNRGLATITYERTRAGAKDVEMTKVRITEAKRAALEAI